MEYHPFERSMAVVCSGESFVLSIELDALTGSSLKALRPTEWTRFGHSCISEVSELRRLGSDSLIHYLS